MLRKWKEFMKRFIAIIQHHTLKKKLRVTYDVIWNLLLILLIFTVVGVSFAGGVGAGYFASLVKDEKVRSYDELKKDVYDYEETSELYFANDVFLGKLRSDIDREEISLDKVSPHLIDAVIATEDQYFYEHNGVVPKALLRAIFQEVTNSSVQSGGSTLTQQLIKNQILTNEVSFDRKAKEILLALRLENFFKKDEILEAYLNVSPFGRNSSGQNIAGVKAAAKGIFGVQPKDLTIPQAAFIAGLPQSPSRYTPFTNTGKVKENLEPGLKRMKTVLYRMHQIGYITDKEYKHALEYDITKDFIPPTKKAFEEYPYLTHEIESQTIKIMTKVLAEKDGFSEKDLKDDENLHKKYVELADRDIRQNGYRIHTTIDKAIYDKMQKVKDEFSGYGPTFTRTVKNEEGIEEEIEEPVQVGAILIENKTGKILSFVGGRDFQLEQTNHATQAKRPNGSTMKPLLVYAPAIEMGKIAPGSVIADTKVSVRAGGSSWSPRNFSNKYYGLVSAREALAKSHNVSAAKIYLKTIDKRPASYLEKMGFTSLTETDYTAPAVSLGGLTNGVTVEENTNAFTTFANQGEFVDAYLIEKIEDQKGNVIYNHKVKKNRVFSPQTAYLTIDMMRDVIKYGTASSLKGMLKFSGDWAGKTGTTNDFKDAWFVASNPKVTFGTWIGYDQPRSLNTPGYENYSRRNLRLWSQLMNGAYDVKPALIAPKERFKMPEGIVKRSYCAVSGKLPSDACAKAGLIVTDLFNAKYVPNEKDNSLIEGRYVYIDGKKYAALKSTPTEFTKTGYVINPEFANQIDEEGLKSLNLSESKLIPAKKIADNGKAPSKVEAITANGKIKWSKSNSSDVIGYRIYHTNGKKIASIHADGTHSYKVGKGKYYVVAVDIAGRESAPSGTVVTKDKQEKTTSKNKHSNKERKEESKNSKQNKGSSQNKSSKQNKNSNQSKNSNQNKNSNQSKSDKQNKQEKREEQSRKPTSENMKKEDNNDSKKEDKSEGGKEERNTSEQENKKENDQSEEGDSSR